MDDLNFTLDDFTGSAYSPQVETSDIEGGHRVDITYESPEGLQTVGFDVLDGEKGDKGDTGDQGPQGETGAAAGFGEVSATVDANVGTPSVSVTADGPDTAKRFSFAFSNLKGERGEKGETGETGQTGATGAAAGFGTPAATVDGGTGTPSVDVSATGPDTAKVFTFGFHNIKGEKGDTGDPAADDSIATSMLKDGAVTHAKLADDALAGAADQLLAATSRTMLGDASDGTFLSRVCPTKADGVAEISEIRGNTAIWNQLAPTRVYSQTPSTYPLNAGTRIYAGHKYLLFFDADITQEGTNPPNLYFYYNSETENSNVYCLATVRAIIFTAANSSISNGTNQVGNPNCWFYIAANGAEFTADIMLIDLTQFYGAGNEPSTVAEFEARWGSDYKPYSAPRMLDTNVLGMRSAGFNQWDEDWENGSINTADGTNTSGTGIRSKNFIPLIAGKQYYLHNGGTDVYFNIIYYSAAKTYLQSVTIGIHNGSVFTIPEGARYMRFAVPNVYGTTYGNDICINVSDPNLNGTYKPHVSDELALPERTLRGIGTAQDVMTRGGIERVIGVFLPTGDGITQYNANAEGYMRARLKLPSDAYAKTLTPTAGNQKSDKLSYFYGTYNYGKEFNFSVSGSDVWITFDATAYPTIAEAKAWLDSNAPVIEYELATPTTEQFDTPIDLTYTVQEGGTETWLVPDGDAPTSAPPTALTAYPMDAADLRDMPLAAIAPIENGLASANYSVGDYLIRNGMLYKVTTAIATGESIPVSSISARTVWQMVQEAMA